MSKVLQHLVSKQKKRFVANGFDLDLTYITDQVIAMGLPASGVTGIYRNPQGEVIRFLDSFHGGQYKIYNLCTRPQDQYDPEKFGGAVCSYPFEDHGVPPLVMVQALAMSVQEWLAPSRDRVVCIHCLAGKGRTGLMVCAVLLHLGLVRSAREAMAFYGERRMKNKKGVTQSSQRRWVEYYEMVLNKELQLQMRSKRTLVGCLLPGCTTPVSVQLQSIDPTSGRPVTKYDSGPFIERCDLSWEFAEDTCLLLTDHEGKGIAQMWIHATMVGCEQLNTTIKWWDVERKNKIGKKLLKLHGVQLLFADENGFKGAGQTLEPVTDKEYRKQCPGEYDELDVEAEDDEDESDRFLLVEDVDDAASLGDSTANSPGKSRTDSATSNARQDELDLQLTARRTRMPAMGWLGGILRASNVRKASVEISASSASCRGSESWFSKMYSPLETPERDSMAKTGLATIASSPSLFERLSQRLSRDSGVMESSAPSAAPASAASRETGDSKKEPDSLAAES